MKKIIKRWLFKIAVSYVASCIRDGQQLTPQLLEANGWILEEGYYVEQNIKQRDKVSVQFENHYYRVFHGRNRTFIALESSKQWLQAYLLLRDKWEKLPLVTSNKQ